MRVFVCAGMGLAKDEIINTEARQLGSVLASFPNVTYVQGGSIEGLMGETLKAFMARSNNFEFLIPDVYFEKDAPRIKELVGEEYFKYEITNGEAGRLRKIIECDRILVFPGGSGTLEELLFTNETTRSGEHGAKITILNIDGFFDGVLLHFKRSMEEGLISRSAINFDVVYSASELDFSE